MPQESLDAFAANPKAAAAPPQYDPNGRGDAELTFFLHRIWPAGTTCCTATRCAKTFHTVIDGVVISLEDATPGKAPVGQRIARKISSTAWSIGGSQRWTKPSCSRRVFRKTLVQRLLGALSGCLGKRYADPKFPVRSNGKKTTLM